MDLVEWTCLMTERQSSPFLALDQLPENEAFIRAPQPGFC